MIEKNRSMRNHVTLVASLRIALSGLWAIAFTGFWFIMAIPLAEVGHEPLAEMVLTIIRNWGTAVGLLFSILGVVGGIGLLFYKSWARVVVIVVSALACLNIPIGTLLGVYFIWVLLQRETVDLFRKGA